MNTGGNRRRWGAGTRRDRGELRRWRERGEGEGENKE